MEHTESKIEGWRKAGIGVTAITALTLKDTINFKVAVIIGTIAVVGIVCQGVLDWRRIRKKVNEQT